MMIDRTTGLLAASMLLAFAPALAQQTPPPAETPPPAGRQDAAPSPGSERPRDSYAPAGERSDAPPTPTGQAVPDAASEDEGSTPDPSAEKPKPQH
jgi:hypothetical protein